MKEESHLTFNQITEKMYKALSKNKNYILLPYEIDRELAIKLLAKYNFRIETTDKSETKISWTFRYIPTENFSCNSNYKFKSAAEKEQVENLLRSLANLIQHNLSNYGEYPARIQLDFPGGSYEIQKIKQEDEE